MRVALFQKGKGGMYYRQVIVNGRRDVRCLDTTDQTEALRLARTLLAAMTAAAELPAAPVALSLGELGERYMAECPMLLDNHPRSRAEARARISILIAFFGQHRDVRTLSSHAAEQYAARRRAGGIRYGEDRSTPPVRQRTVQADLALLRAMVRWATTVATPDGGRWLERNPLDGLRIAREKNPKRPVATDERYTRTIGEIRRRQLQARSEADKERWTRAEMGVFLLRETGRRRGAIVALRWEDIDFGQRLVRWRAEADKGRRDGVIPMPHSFFTAMREFRQRLGAVGGHLFPARKHKGGAMPPELLSQWILDAEEGAKLEKLEGGVTHPYRRQFASERMHLPTKALADAGGWTDVATLTTCYQHADRSLLLKVMSDRRPIRDVTIR